MLAETDLPFELERMTPEEEAAFNRERAVHARGCSWRYTDIIYCCHDCGITGVVYNEHDKRRARYRIGKDGWRNLDGYWHCPKCVEAENARH